MTDQPTLDRFEEALLTSLREEISRHDRSAPRRRPARRLVLAGGVAASVGAVLAGSFLFQPEAAYALDPKPDGDIVVTISSLEDAEGLERALRAEGVEAEVDYDADLPDDLLIDEVPGDGARVGVGAGTGGSVAEDEFDGTVEKKVEIDEDTLLGDPRGPEEELATERAEKLAEGALGDAPLPDDLGACAMSVESRADGGVTFRLPASIVESDAVLHITTSGTDDGWNAIMVRWEGDVC